jgi:predicted nucleic acid-binding protein
VTPGSSAVFDASVVLRAVVDGADDALEWFGRVNTGELRAAWPQLALIEVANAFTTLVLARRFSRERAAGALARVVALPVDAVPLDVLAIAAFAIATARRLSAYDACYVALAEALDAPLVTADRRLAAATSNAILIAP